MPSNDGSVQLAVSVDRQIDYLLLSLVEDWLFENHLLVDMNERLDFAELKQRHARSARRPPPAVLLELLEQLFVQS